MRLVTLAGPLKRRSPILHLAAVAAALALGVTATAQSNETPTAEDAQAAAPDLMPVVVSQEPSPKSPAISVSGTVQNEAGEPLAGASVVLRADLGGSQYVFGVSHNRDVLARTTTNGEGRFRFEGIGIPPRLVGNLDQLRQGTGGFYVVAWVDGYALDWKTVTSFDAPETGFKLTREADVSGVVVDEQGVPLKAGELRVTGFTKAVDNLDPTFRNPGDLNIVLSEVRFVGEVREGRFDLHHMPQDYRISVECESAAGHRAFFLIDTGNGTSTDFGYRYSSSRNPVYRTPIRA